MMRTILSAALLAAFAEAGAQTPPLPPVPTVPPVAPAPPAPTAVPRLPEVGDLIAPRAPRHLYDDDLRAHLELGLRREEIERVMEDARYQREEARHMMEQSGFREELRRSLEDARVDIHEARRMAELEVHGSLRDRYMDAPLAIAPMPPTPPMPPVLPAEWSEALRRFESYPTPLAGDHDFRWAPSVEAAAPEAWLPQDPGDSLYRAARDLLNRGQYRNAAETFRLLSQKYPTSGYTPSVMYYEAFSLYRIGGQNELRAALQVLERQRTRFPNHSNPDPALPTRIRGELANRGDQSAAEAVATAASRQGQACNKDEMAVRIEALNALSRMNIDSTTPILRRVLARRDECSVTLRRQAITLMTKSTDAATTDLMIDVMKNDPSIEVRRAAMSWLASVPSDRGSAALEELLRSPKDEALHASAIRALSSSQNPRGPQAIRTLIAQTDVSERIRGDAMATLTRIDSAGAGAYLRSVYPKLETRRLKEQALTAIGRLKDADNQRWMLAFVRDTTEPVQLRRAALSTLTRSSTTTVAEIGGLYSGVSELELRTQIITSLAARKEPEAVDQLIAIYRGTNDPKLRVQIINVLSRRDDPRTQKLLIEILDK